MTPGSRNNPVINAELAETAENACASISVNPAVSAFGVVIRREPQSPQRSPGTPMFLGELGELGG
jgi:hypothetical protein